jgi:hypothetical protein
VPSGDRRNLVAPGACGEHSDHPNVDLCRWPDRTALILGSEAVEVAAEACSHRMIRSSATIPRSIEQQPDLGRAPSTASRAVSHADQVLTAQPHHPDMSRRRTSASIVRGRTEIDVISAPSAPSLRRTRPRTRLISRKY